MKTIVLGGGVIGTTTAYFLARAGHEVHVVDRQPGVACETSHANGGVLHTSEAEPWSRPGVPRKILGWLGREDAPMLLRLRALPHMWRWGLSFVAHSTQARYRKATRDNLRLSLYSLDMLNRIRAEVALDYDQQARGSMKIYTDHRAFDAMAAESEAMRPYGIQFEAVDRDRCVELEPALAPVRETLAGGLYYPPDETGDCAKFTLGLAEECRKLGVAFHFRRTAEALLTSGRRIEAVATDGGRMTADRYVVAMGSYTPLILRRVGIRLPIYPVKGLTVTVPAEPWPDGPRMPIIDDSRLFGLTRLGDRYRCPGSVEIARYDTTPSPARCQAIVDNVISVFPEFARCYDPSTVRFWAGLRPMTPSGNPYLGATPIDNLFVNSGHGHLGWTMACGSARVVADVVAGRTPEIDMDGLTLARHN